MHHIASSLRWILFRSPFQGHRVILKILAVQIPMTFEAEQIL